MKERKYQPAWRSFYKHMLTIIACVVIVLILSVNLPSSYQFWLWIVFGIIIICTISDMMYKRNSVILIVKSDEISIERGFIGRQSIEISIRDIRTIKVNQSIIQRLLNVGDIRVASSGTGEYEIYAYNMPYPHQIREFMQENERAAGKE